jgi:hypothetical protein
MTMPGHNDPTADPVTQQEQQSPISRRAALRGGAAAGLAGAALVATGTPALAAARPASRAESVRASADERAEETIVVHVRNLRTGELDIFRGTSQTRVHNAALAAQLARAGR